MFQKRNADWLVGFWRKSACFGEREEVAVVSMEGRATSGRGTRLTGAGQGGAGGACPSHEEEPAGHS